MIVLILASQSPRRRELIRILGYPFQSETADVDESSITHPDPAVNVIETATLKAEAIAAKFRRETPAERQIIIAADTTVAVDRQMLGKPADQADAQHMLRRLRNRTHQVHTGISLIDLTTGRRLKDVHTARVTMRNYTDDEIATYVASGDPMDKAGAYAIQHPTFRPAAVLHGCYTGVMGLSLCHLIRSLSMLDVPPRFDFNNLQRAHQQFPCSLLMGVSRLLS